MKLKIILIAISIAILITGCQFYKPDPTATPTAVSATTFAPTATSTKAPTATPRPTLTATLQPTSTVWPTTIVVRPTETVIYPTATPIRQPICYGRRDQYVRWITFEQWEKVLGWKSCPEFYK